jgi:hypothetical protein
MLFAMRSAYIAASAQNAQSVASTKPEQLALATQYFRRRFMQS